MDFAKLLEQMELLEKFELSGKRGCEPMETREEDSCPWANPPYKVSVVSVVWNISMG